MQFAQAWLPMNYGPLTGVQGALAQSPTSESAGIAHPAVSGAHARASLFHQLDDSLEELARKSRACRQISTGITWSSERRVGGLLERWPEVRQPVGHLRICLASTVFAYIPVRMTDG
jgi:hypothetical protein